MPPIEAPHLSNRDRAIAYSRSQFSRPRAEVEGEIDSWMRQSYVDPTEEAKEREKAERRFTTRQGEAPRPRTFERDRAVPEREAREPRMSPQNRPRVEASAPPLGGYRAPRAPFFPPPPHQTHAVSDAPRPMPPRPRPVEPRPLPPHQGSLKDILAKVAPPPATTTPQVSPPPVAPPQPSHSLGVPPQRPPVGVPERREPVRAPLPPQTARIDNGKGVSPEGRQALRDLLAKVTQVEQSAPNVKPPVMPSRPPQPAPPVPPAPQPQTQHTPRRDTQEPTPPPHTPQGGAESPATHPREVPEDTLRTLLAVKRPNIP